MNIELSRFKVKNDKKHVVDEWMSFLNLHMKDVLLTLDREKMYVETIFREEYNSEEYLYWFSIQGNGGADVEDSEHWVDHKHLQFWDECIDESVKPTDLQPSVVMLPQYIKRIMD